MKYIKLFLFFSCITTLCHAQKRKINQWLLKADAGYHMFDIDLQDGYYYKVGTEYKPAKNWRFSLHFEHTQINTFIRDFSYNVNSTIDTAAYFKLYRGMTKSEWFQGKGSFLYWSANIVSLEAMYDIHFKKGSRFFISPKFGISRIQSNYFNTYLYEAYFHNDLLTGGKLTTDVCISRFWGLTYGFEFNYQLKPIHGIFVDLEKVNDMARWKDGKEMYYSGVHYYNSWKLGVGYKFSITN